MIIQINKYDPKVFKFAQLYLRVEVDQWLGTPRHRLVSHEFLKDLDDGKLDFTIYDIKYNPVYFDGEECLILLRYYHKHKHYDKYTNISRLYSELGLFSRIGKKVRKAKVVVENTLALDRVIILKICYSRTSIRSNLFICVRRVDDIYIIGY
jgi:hypothetical protein